MNRSQLMVSKDYYLHHTAAKKGYVSRKVSMPDIKAKKYSGKFGDGYTVELPRWDTTQYIYVEYYIRKKTP